MPHDFFAKLGAREIKGFNYIIPIIRREISYSISSTQPALNVQPYLTRELTTWLTRANHV